MKSTHTTIKHLTLAILMAAVLWGCTGLRKLEEGEYLFAGSKIEFDSAHLLTEPGAAKAELYELIRPNPNVKFFWMRPFLSIHNMVKEPKKEKGFKYWLKYKLGEKPAKLSDVYLPQINAAMVNRLQNRGYFEASSSHEIVRKRKTAKIVFLEEIQKPYTIRSIKFPQGASNIINRINELKDETLIVPGMTYKLSVFESERDRINLALKNKGYFYFAADNLVFDADTTVGIRQIDVELMLKQDTPEESSKAYKLGELMVYDDYSLKDYHPDTAIIGNYIYLSAHHYYKPKTILDAVFLEKDSLYSRTLHYNTLNYLMGLNVYKYANARFTKSDSTANTLKVEVALTPHKKKTLGAEVSAELKTNNYLGPGVKLSYKNRNTFRGAEMLSINLGTRFETQFSGDYQGQTNYEITLDATLSLPRLVPLKFGGKTARKYVPTTDITVGGGLFSRIELYELHSFYTSFGYHWRSSKKVSQILRPADISFTNLAKSSQEFNEYLDENPTIKKSFEEQFILGASYAFTYSTLFEKQNKMNFFYMGSIDIAGNIASLLSTAVLGYWPSPENQHNILGVPYSQYVRLRNEIRFFVNMSKKHNVGIRFIMGNGIPYGNSNILPYVKQFYVGGTNSVRAFRARTVGPGTYLAPDSISGIYIDQSGDIKVESSLEYRFTIYKYLKGAAFVDAGNIWLYADDPQRPGGKFNINTFYSEFAVGTGFGFRLDFSVAVIRFDFAYPLRKPYLPEGERWIFNAGKNSGNWNGNEMVFNVAIGYPF